VPNTCPAQREHQQGDRKERAATLQHAPQKERRAPPAVPTHTKRDVCPARSIHLL
jgi:hypothetical protein